MDLPEPVEVTQLLGGPDDPANQQRPQVQSFLGMITECCLRTGEAASLGEQAEKLRADIDTPGALLWGENYVSGGKDEALYNLADVLHVFCEGEDAVAECYAVRVKHWADEPYATYMKLAGDVVSAHEYFRAAGPVAAITAALAALLPAVVQRPRLSFSIRAPPRVGAGGAQAVV